MKRRVLVADDVADMRVLIRRVLAASGYEVDVASTLGEARAMDPRGYDAVLVDAQLGSERGADLIEELRSADPAAAGRCLVITGGPATALPAGVAVLAKPFTPAQLLAAILAVQQPDTGVSRDRPPAGIPVPGFAPKVPLAREGEQRVADHRPAWPLLDITRRLRARERGGLACLLHDKPMQELAAAALELELLRRSAPPGLAPALDAVTRRLAAAAGSLRSLVDEEWPLLHTDPGLAAAVRQRTGWLLTAPLAVEAGQRLPLRPDEISVVADVTEIMLLALVPEGLMARARLAASAEESVIRLALTVWPEDKDAAIADPDTANSALDELEELAAALGTGVRFWPHAQQWAAEIALPRQAASDRDEEIIPRP